MKSRLPDEPGVTTPRVTPLGVFVFPSVFAFSNRSSPPQRLSVRRTRFRGPIATRRFSTDTPKIAAPTLGVSAEHPSQS